RGVLIEESLRRQDDAAEAKAALRRLLVDERFLNRVRVVRRTETFERGDLGAVHRADRRDARADRAAADDDRAGAALPEAAAEFRAPKREIVAQDVEQRRGRVDDLALQDRKSTRLNSRHGSNSYAVFCLKKQMRQKPYIL